MLAKRGLLNLNPGERISNCSGRGRTDSLSSISSRRDEPLEKQTQGEEQDKERTENQPATADGQPVHQHDAGQQSGDASSDVSLSRPKRQSQTAHDPQSKNHAEQ